MKTKMLMDIQVSLQILQVPLTLPISLFAALCLAFVLDSHVSLSFVPVTCSLLFLFHLRSIPFLVPNPLPSPASPHFPICFPVCPSFYHHSTHRAELISLLCSLQLSIVLDWVKRFFAAIEMIMFLFLNSANITHCAN